MNVLAEGTRSLWMSSSSSDAVEFDRDGKAASWRVASLIAC
jgi:hypothetical protein